MTIYTIDQFIERLEELRAVAEKGGETPVAVELGRDFAPAAAQLCYVENEEPVEGVWLALKKVKLDESAFEVLSVF